MGFRELKKTLTSLVGGRVSRGCPRRGRVPNPFSITLAWQCGLGALVPHLNDGTAVVLPAPGFHGD